MHRLPSSMRGCPVGVPTRQGTARFANAHRSILTVGSGTTFRSPVASKSSANLLKLATSSVRLALNQYVKNGSVIKHLASRYTRGTVPQSMGASEIRGRGDSPSFQLYLYVLFDVI